MANIALRPPSGFMNDVSIMTLMTANQCDIWTV